MKKNINIFLLIVSLFFLTSCEKLFTLEGTIYIKEGKSIARLSGTKIYLLDNNIDTIISKSLTEYSNESEIAIKKYASKLLQEEIDKNQKQLSNINSQIKKNKIALSESKKLTEKNLKELSSSAKATEEAELKNKKKTYQLNMKILDLKKELQLLNELVEVKKRNLSAVLITRKKELGKLNNKMNKKLAAAKKTYAINMNKFKQRIKSIRNEVSDLKKSYEKSQKSIVSKYFWRYVQDKILVVNKLEKPCRSCTPQLTFFIENKGNKAIRAVEFDLYYKNISLRNSGFKLSDFGAYGLDRIWYPQSTNRYRETVYGIAPKKRMLKSKSIYLRTRRRMQGDTLRFFEKMGGYDPSAFKVVIKKAYLSDPSTYHSYNPYSSKYMRNKGIKRWRYKKQKVADVFKKEINNSEFLKKTKDRIKKVLFRQIKLTKEIIQRKTSFSNEKKNISVVSNAFLKKKRKEISKAEKDIVGFKLTKEQREKITKLRKSISSIQLTLNSSAFSLKQMKINTESLKKKKILFKGLVEVAQKRSDSSLSEKTKIELEIKNLKNKKGNTFSEIQKFAKTNTPLLEMQSLWITKFIENIKSSKIQSANSNIEGKFKFEKLTRKIAYLFAVANHDNKRFLWFIELDLTSNNQQDLSDINNTIIDVKYLNKLFEYFNKAISVKSEDVPTKDIVPSKN